MWFLAKMCEEIMFWKDKWFFQTLLTVLILGACTIDMYSPNFILKSHVQNRLQRLLHVLSSIMPHQTTILYY